MLSRFRATPNTGKQRKWAGVWVVSQQVVPLTSRAKSDPKQVYQLIAAEGQGDISNRWFKEIKYRYVQDEETIRKWEEDFSQQKVAIRIIVPILAEGETKSHYFREQCARNKDTDQLYMTVDASYRLAEDATYRQKTIPVSKSSKTSTRHSFELQKAKKEQTTV